LVPHLGCLPFWMHHDPAAGLSWFPLCYSARCMALFFTPLVSLGVVSSPFNKGRTSIFSVLFTLPFPPWVQGKKLIRLLGFRFLPPLPSYEEPLQINPEGALQPPFLSFRQFFDLFLRHFIFSPGPLVALVVIHY